METEVRHSRAETDQRVGAMDDSPCSQRRMLIEYVSETFFDSVALVRLIQLYAACVSQRRRDNAGQQTPEDTHASMNGIQRWSISAATAPMGC